MQQTNQEIIVTIIAVVILLIIISIIILLLTVYYSNSKKRLLKEKDLLKAAHEQAILQLKVEIQEETLSNISREIHDNITQVLSFVKLNLAMIDNVDENCKNKIIESRELVAQTINDLRNLSKSMSFEHIANIGLVNTIDIEIDRINSSGLLHALFLIDGDSYSLGEQRELVLFRIFQEALNNTLKHAKAKQLKITLQYSKQIFNLIVEDDGRGFSPKQVGVNEGSGLKNIQNRAALIGAVATIDSLPNKGCCIKVTLNPLETTYIHGWKLSK